MIGEREYATQQYGTLSMRAYDIAGNVIKAFYDSDGNLVFVLDNTINASKPNVLLVINPDGDKKWDEILSTDYDVDLETIRPKQDNKYQKLDIEYSGLSIYESLIQAYLDNEDLEEPLIQLDVLRDSAMRHSAMVRLSAANEAIAKTQTTIVKTKETIIRLQERLKTLRSTLSATRKEIGKVPTKNSASRILKLESQIDATDEKLKRAKKRLESARHRMEVATVDAELASALLNQPSISVHQNKNVVATQRHAKKSVRVEQFDDNQVDTDEEADEEESDSQVSDVKPLFDNDPEIINEDIAFKPISFDAPTFESTQQDTNVPMLNQEVFEESSAMEIPTSDTVETFESNVPEFTPQETPVETKPVLETMTPVVARNEFPQIDTSYLPEPDSVASDYSVPSSFEPALPEVEQSAPIAPIAESLMPVVESEPIAPTLPQSPVEPIVSETPKAPVPPVAPVAPVSPNVSVVPVNSAQDTATHKPTFIYYLLLLVLIALSIFTLWLYQKNVKPGNPVLSAVVPEVVETAPTKSTEQQPVAEPVEEIEDEVVFLDEEVSPDEIVEPVSEVVEEEPADVPVNEEEYAEPESEEYVEEVAPEIMDSVPARVMSSGLQEDLEPATTTEEEILLNKPVYEPGAKYDDMFITDETYEGYDDYENGSYNAGGEYDNGEYYDEEEEQYLSGDDGYYYE